MGREIRQVPPNWEHPRRENGNYKPLYDRAYLGQIITHFRWEALPCFKHPRWIKDFFTGWPSRGYSRPFWPKRKATHFQMYETVTEGTPVSPVFATRAAIADWLVEQGHTRRAADEFARQGWAPSMVFTGRRPLIGIDAYDDPDTREDDTQSE